MNPWLWVPIAVLVYLAIVVPVAVRAARALQRNDRRPARSDTPGDAGTRRPMP